MVDTAPEILKRTPLHELHRELGARMVPFAGYDMPLHYRPGILAEHQHTRAAAGLFDVSHMGQAFLVGPDHRTTASSLERLVPGDVLGLKPGQVRYTLLLREDGGIVDDLMVTRSPRAEDDGALSIVVNASRKDVDYSFLEATLPRAVRVHRAADRALLAVQGPRAAEVVARHVPAAQSLGFMTACDARFGEWDCRVSRSGYTGEDGFEISLPGGCAEAAARALLREPEVTPVGLGARDSLRLEAGLCLYGHDIDESTSPVEADLVFAIARRRREEGGFNGADRILREIRNGPARRRVGILPEGKAPAREGTEVAAKDGRRIGRITSGGFGPTVGGPIAMGYVEADCASPGTELDLVVRGIPRPAFVAAMPFVPHRYARKTQA